MPKPRPRRPTFFPDDEPKEPEHDPKLAERSLRQLRRHDEPRPKRRRGVKSWWEGPRPMTEQRKPITTVDEFRAELEALMGRASALSIRDRLKLLEAWCDYLIEVEGGDRVFVRA
jgi:hypothetical protein